MDRSFKFRISYRVLEKGATEERSIEFLYRTFKEARKNYKSIILGLYRLRKVRAYRICLNRTRDRRWENPIYEDSGEK